MAKCVMINTTISADHDDSLNRSVISTVDIDNGTPLSLEFPTEKGSNVFKATKNTTGKNVWIAFSPEVDYLTVGSIYSGVDIRSFTNVANKPYDAFKPTVSDIIQVTKEFFGKGKSPADVTGAKYVSVGASGFEATATAPTSGLVMNIGRKEPMIFATPGIGGEEVDAWYLEVMSV